MITHRRLLHLEHGILDPGRGLPDLVEAIHTARKAAHDKTAENPEWLATDETIMQRARQVRAALGRY